ncbi:hypothetical protein Tco_1398008 [Tanacetum coccineum]
MNMSHLVYTDAQTTSVVHNPEGNPKLTSYIPGASEVQLGTHVDVLAIKTLMQEMFPYENAHHIPSLPGKKIPYPTTTPQPNSLQAKAKKLMQKVKKNMRKINFKKAVAQKFREYDQKLEAFIKDDTPAMQPLDKADTLIQKHSNPEWFPKKSRLAKRRTTWFDLFLKSDIDKDENHILGPSTVAIAKKFKELIQKDELTIAYLEGERIILLLSLSIMLQDITKKVLRIGSLKDEAKKFVAIILKLLMEYTIGKRIELISSKQE